jgi:hypothetical protein
MTSFSNIIHGEGEQDNYRQHNQPPTRAVDGSSSKIISLTCRTTPPVGAIFSLLMLLTTASGRCYSFSEIKLWMEDAGLSHVQQIDLPPPLTSSLVIGAK